jgi:hypothetical protein
MSSTKVWASPTLPITAKAPLARAGTASTRTAYTSSASLGEAYRQSGSSGPCEKCAEPKVGTKLGHAE